MDDAIQTEIQPQPEISLDEARNALQAEQQKRVAACEAEINDVLKKHQCAMTVAMVVSAQGNEPIVRVIPTK